MTDRLAIARRRIADERGRVLRCLDDIRHGEGKTFKVRMPPLYWPGTPTHRDFLARTGRAWLPLAWRAYRAAQADLRILEAMHEWIARENGEAWLERRDRARAAAGLLP